MLASRRSDDRGAVLVEFALILPILTMLLLGLVSGAIAWNENLALSQGARVAGRRAVTTPLPATQTSVSMGPWLDAVANHAVAASEGKMASTVSGRAVCVAYVYPAGTAADQTFKREVTGTGTPTYGTTPCFEDGQSDTDRRVQVVLSRDAILDLGLRRIALTLRRQVVYRFEAHAGL